jgi:adenylate cyclase
MERRLAAILVADVVGYTRLMGADEAGTLGRLTEIRQHVLEPLIAEHHGRVVKLMGDGLLVEFASVVDAVTCAVAWQSGVAEREVAADEDKSLKFRIGINLGDVIVENDDIFGDGVNIAARLEGQAEPGGICLSSDAYRQAKGKVKVDFEDLGDQDLKNVAEPIRVYRVAGQRPRSGTPSPANKPLARSSKPSVAVLPFTNMSADPGQQYFSDGITEDIITMLSQIPGFSVIARNSSFVYRDAADIRKVGRDLGVGFVVEGTVRRAARRVRVTAQLIDSKSGYHIWADRFDRELDDLFAVQDEVTDRIVEALQVRLRGRYEARPQRQAPQSFEAYDLVLRAIEAGLRFLEEANAEARDLCERAIILDPYYAEAHARLANTYLQEWNQGWNRCIEDTLDRAELLALKAIELNDELAIAHAMLEHVCLWKKEHDRAIRAGERALLLDPNNSDTLAIHAMTLSWAGRPEDALPVVEKGMRLNPHHPHWYHFVHGLAFFEVQRLEDAVMAFRRGVARAPQFMPNHFYLAVAYGEQGRDLEASAEATEVIHLNPAMTVEYARHLLPYRDRGRLEHCLSSLQRAGIPK